MTSIEQVYQFELTKILREDGLKRAAYIRSVNQDIATEMDYDMSLLPLLWNIDVTGHFLTLRVLIPAEDARFMAVVLHSLHGAKLLEEKFSKKLS